MGSLVRVDQKINEPKFVYNSLSQVGTFNPHDNIGKGSFQ